MRLLVTNTRCAQAYAVTRALRPHAEKIVATMAGPRPLGIWPTCHAAFSRLVDRRYQVPDPEQDWHEGRIQRNNTPREQAFIDAILGICARERIDTIFPSNDPWTYVFAKNRATFEARGVVVPVPDYDTVLKPLDKYATVRIAEEVGFPVPNTWLPEGEADIRRIAQETPPPWVIKPRFTTGGRGMAVVTDAGELLDRTLAVREHHGMPTIQEYIPGRGKQNFALVIDKDGRLLSAFTPSVVRIAGRVFRNQTGACRSTLPHSLTDKATRVVAGMGWWGGATLQTKLDARDGQYKLMEVNPRLGTHLWYRTELGINEPLMCLQIAKGETIEPVADYPVDYTLLEPLEDITGFLVECLDLAVYRLRTGVLRRRAIDEASAPPSLPQLFRYYREPYRHPKKRYSPYVTYALEDPLPALIWASKLLGRRMFMNMKGLGR